jgi:hypothetical protein
MLIDVDWWETDKLLPWFKGGKDVDSIHGYERL